MRFLNSIGMVWKFLKILAFLVSVSYKTVSYKKKRVDKIRIFQIFDFLAFLAFWGAGIRNIPSEY